MESQFKPEGEVKRKKQLQNNLYRLFNQNREHDKHFKCLSCFFV